MMFFGFAPFVYGCHPLGVSFILCCVDRFACQFAFTKEFFVIIIFYLS